MALSLSTAKHPVLGVPAIMTSSPDLTLLQCLVLEIYNERVSVGVRPRAVEMPNQSKTDWRCPGQNVSVRTNNKWKLVLV